METSFIETQKISFQDFKKEVLEDYKIARISREVSLQARREVLTGKAKFGIHGDGKELAQIALAKVFKPGDFRSGYYRDQTIGFATGVLTVEGFFAQLYADTNVTREPSTAGRTMNGHFGTRFLDENGQWMDQTKMINFSSDISPTACQMPRLLGLAQASKVYKEIQFEGSEKFSQQGQEIAFGTIGDASTAEGMFWETLNAAGAMQVPMVVSIWDDGFGISVETQFQRAKKDLGDMFQGFKRSHKDPQGFEVIQVNAWDYPALLEAYAKAEHFARNLHIPVIVHVTQTTQPFGHSTSGSHERYKDQARMDFEIEMDCISKFKTWILDYKVDIDQEIFTLGSETELAAIEAEAKKIAKNGQKNAWAFVRADIEQLKANSLPFVEALAEVSANQSEIRALISSFNAAIHTIKKDVFGLVRKTLFLSRHEQNPQRQALVDYYQSIKATETDNYSSHLYSQSAWNATKITEIAPVYSEDSEWVDGRVILRDNFDQLFQKHPQLMIFGEDSGKIGDVNQGLEGLQTKFGSTRVADTGIRETTIIGQGIGLAMRGLKPIAEIQYLDYILYCLQILSDDLATLQYRTKGGQKAPMIIRTRGHRLEGIWHSGSPMAGILNLVRGIYLLVPRNMSKAAGFYNTMLESDESAIVVEPLNGYRLKEKTPSNLGEFRLPIGQVEVTNPGHDVTLLTYGSTWRLVVEAAQELQKLGISAEIIDAQSLIPFDTDHQVVQSIQKTNRLAIIDEDVPGGATAYLLHQILQEQKAFKYLDTPPMCITAKEHRPAYSTDGDYFSKPSADDIVEQVYAMFNDVNPSKYPQLY